MSKKVLHSIAALFLVLLFQMPTWTQFAHSFHEHDSIRICDAKDSEFHFHNAIDDSCTDLHKVINPNLLVPVFEYPENVSVPFYEKLNLKSINTGKQLLLFSDLRAPPTSIL